MFIQTSFGGNSPPKVLSFPSNDLPSSCSETITFDFLTVSFLPLPKKPTPLSALGLDFRPFGLHSVVSPNSLHFPPMLGVWIKHCITFHGLAHPKLIWGSSVLILTTEGSWLPRGRVAKPLVGPLTPVPRIIQVQRI